MKYLEAFHGKAATQKLNELFVTDAFRNDQGELVLPFDCDRPFFTYEPTDFALERYHFTSWMGAIQLREYDNPYIQDLYYLHEFWHLMTMPYEPEITFAQWHTKMCENEAEAAFYTEVQTHLNRPDLRKDAFDFEIWADRFLDLKSAALYLKDHYVIYGSDPEKQRAYSVIIQYADEKRGAEAAGHYIRKIRDRAVRNPNHMDFIEMQQAMFAKQNYEWSLTWQRSWREVEQHMLDYLKGFNKVKSSPSARASVCENHRLWLESKMDRGIPFRAEAEVFSRVAADLRDRGGNQILKT